MNLMKRDLLSDRLKYIFNDLMNIFDEIDNSLLIEFVEKLG